MSAPCIDFSIIVPTYNRQQQLEVCLNALAALRYAPDQFEVIVVDDGSTEAIAQRVASTADRLSLTVVRQDNAGPAAARNRGVEQARGAWLAFVDDDCLADPEWLQSLAVRLRQQPDCVFGGRTVNGLATNPYSATSQIIVDAVYRHYNVRPEEARFFASNNLAMPRTLFHRIGGFDRTFTTSEDRDFCDRCTAQGVRMVYAPECIVRHEHALSLWGFCRQHFGYGRGAFRFLTSQLQRHSRDTWSKTSFHLNVMNWLVHPFRQVKPRQWPLQALLLAIWQVMNLAGFAAEAAGSIAAGRARLDSKSR